MVAGSTPSAAATRLPSPTGESQIPMTRLPRKSAIASGSYGLLAQHTLVESDALIDGAPLKTADADRGEDEISSRDGLVEVGGHAHLWGVGCAVRLLGEDAADHRHPGGIDVVEGDVGDAPLAAIVEECPVHQRHPEPSAAEDRQPHTSITSTPASRMAARVPCSPGAFVTRTSSFSGPHTRAIPVPGNLPMSATRITCLLAAIMARLTGTSTTVVSMTWPPGRMPLVPRKSRSAWSCRRLSSVRKPTRDR